MEKKMRGIGQQSQGKGTGWDGRNTHETVLGRQITTKSERVKGKGQQKTYKTGTGGKKRGKREKTEKGTKKSG